MPGRDADIAILGGGLSGGLAALALAIRRPDLKLLLVEAGDSLGGNHVWSFFASDVAAADRWLTDPLVACRWSGHSVRFPRKSRVLSAGYASITSASFDAGLRKALPAEAIMTGARVASATRGGFRLDDGREFRAGVVIDARGLAAFPGLVGGWQKFVGQKLRLEGPHGLSRPMIMDARIRQADGFRFVYCLPFSPDTVFVEDTYYSDTPDIDRDALTARIAEYCQLANWRVAEVLGEEQGVLPVVAGGDFAAFCARGQGRGVPAIGVRAGLFHPLTGYSLPTAVQTALVIADLPDMSAVAVEAALADHASAHWRATGYYRLLARMLFGAALPARRYKVFERFYRLGQPLIQRFYAGRLTRMDQLRLLIGKPPVSVVRALASLIGKGLPLARLDAIKGEQA